MSHPPENLQRRLELWAWAAIGLNVLLSALNLAMACASGSVAIAAELVHNVVDLSASVAVLVGLKLSGRHSQRFPYGLHKVENIVAAGIAILIFLAAYELVRKALGGESQGPVPTWVLVGVLLSALLPLVFSIFEARAARAANSPSLLADAREFRVHVLTSGVILVALLGRQAGIALPLEQVASLVVVVVVVKTGWELLSDAMRVLLDASLDSETLAAAREILARAPAVVRVRALSGHNAGRVRFVEATVEVRVQNLHQAEGIKRDLEQRLRQEIPFLERVRLEVVSVARDTLRVAVSLAGLEGPVSQHFGTAAHFLIATHRRDGAGSPVQTLWANPYADGPRGRGLQVARWLIEQDVDVVVTRDDICEKGPAHALREAGVAVIVTAASDPPTAEQEGVAALASETSAASR